MFSTPELTISYIKRRPGSAARVLASLPPGSAADFLQEIPTRFAVSVFAHMHPGPAALVLQRLDVASGGAIIRDLGFAEAQAILRQIAAADRVEYLTSLSRRARREMELALGYPTGTVGEKMTTAVTTLSETDNAASAIELIRQAEHDHADVIFAVDDNRKLLGAVSIATLLRHPPRTLLADLLDRSCVSISAHSRLDSIVELDAWHDYRRLPVVGRRGEVIGAISRKALRPIDQGGLTEAQLQPPTMIESMAGALGVSVAGLLDLLISPVGLTDDHGDHHER